MSCACFDEYTGSNSHLFQKAASLLVHEIHDAALKRKISFLLDGTFASEGMARQNIQRSIKRKRDVHVHQHPQVAWEFVQKRELVEGRRIRMDDFAQKFCASWEVVDAMKKEFGTRITLGLLCKNIDGGNKFYKKSIERVGDHIPQQYTAEQILDEIGKQG